MCLSNPRYWQQKQFKTGPNVQRVRGKDFISAHKNRGNCNHHHSTTDRRFLTIASVQSWEIVSEGDSPQPEIKKQLKQERNQLPWYGVDR